MTGARRVAEHDPAGGSRGRGGADGRARSYRSIRPVGRRRAGRRSRRPPLGQGEQSGGVALHLRRGRSSSRRSARRAMCVLTVLWAITSRLGDLAGGAPLGHQAQHLALAAGEARDRPAGPAPPAAARRRSAPSARRRARARRGPPRRATRRRRWRRSHPRAAGPPRTRGRRARESASTGTPGTTSRIAKINDSPPGTTVATTRARPGCSARRESGATRHDDAHRPVRARAAASQPCRPAPSAAFAAATRIGTGSAAGVRARRVSSGATRRRGAPRPPRRRVAAGAGSARRSPYPVRVTRPRLSLHGPGGPRRRCGRRGRAGRAPSPR